MDAVGLKHLHPTENMIVWDSRHLGRTVRETAMMPHLPYPRRTFTPALPATAGGLDLQSQLEAILDSVWKAEADWRFNDRLDMALKTRGDNLNPR